MQKIKEYVTLEAIAKADRFSDFRNACKEYLGDYYKQNDKFTTVEHDSYIGYLTEYWCLLQGNSSVNTARSLQSVIGLLPFLSCSSCRVLPVTLISFLLCF